MPPKKIVHSNHSDIITYFHVGPHTNVQTSYSPSPSSRRSKRSSNKRSSNRSSKSSREFEFKSKSNSLQRRRTAAGRTRNRNSPRERGAGRKRHSAPNSRRSNRIVPHPSPRATTPTLRETKWAFVSHLYLFFFAWETWVMNTYAYRRNECSIDDFSVCCTLGKVSNFANIYPIELQFLMLQHHDRDI